MHIFCVICLESLPTWHFLFWVLSTKLDMLTQYSTYLHFYLPPVCSTEKRFSVPLSAERATVFFSGENVRVFMNDGVGFPNKTATEMPRIHRRSARFLPRVVLKCSLVFAEDELERSDVNSEPLWVLKPAMESCLIEEVWRRLPRFHLLAKMRQKQNANVVEGCTVFLLTRICLGDHAAFVHFYNFHFQKHFLTPPPPPELSSRPS